MSINLETLTVPELSALIERAHEEIKRRKVEDKARLKDEIAEKLKNSGLDLSDLFPEAGKKAKKPRQSGVTKPATIKYRDPVSGETWAGRGARPPRWVQMIMSQRRWTLEEFKNSGEYDA
jgi:DNA-binding protein H-NS